MQILFHFSESVFFGNNTVFEDGLQHVVRESSFLLVIQVVDGLQGTFGISDDYDFTGQGFLQVLVVGFRVFLDEDFFAVDFGVSRL